MKINKIFHTLYFMVMFLPLFIIPIFAININQKSVEPISIDVYESQNVNFRQQLRNGQFYDNTTGWVSNGLSMTIVNHTVKLDVDGNPGTSIYSQTNADTPIIGHKYLVSFNASAIGQVRAGFGYGGNYQTDIFTLSTQIQKCQKIFEPSNTQKTFYLYANATYSTYVSNLQLFDLSEMYGLGNEPTINEFNIQFSDIYYDYSDNAVSMLVNKATPTTYDNTDIGSQFLYSVYKPVNDYFDFKQYFGMNAIYDWFQLNFFNGTAPLSFFIFFNLMIYWLIISMLWLLFDVLIYVPLMIHRWLDKASIS